ncbi:hypothetical protein KKE92_05110 [Candidatus Micrarchaeota archaeon]|nr:hypothetical protein [Candidatus Micrarchaeota archaeon]MBU1681698.1 hypothetical protein [Candidatus Micrarchaeota archaeon]
MDYKFVMLALLLVPMASANPGIFDMGKGDGLEAAMDNIGCRADFTVGVLESQISILGADELQDDVDDIEDDVDELVELVDDGDVSGFREYVHGDYSQHMKNARQNALQSRNQGNMTHGVKAQLRDAYNSLKEDFEACNSESMGRFAQAKIDGYEEILERAGEQSEDLSEKGVDTTALDALIADAEDEIVDPLKDAVDEAETSEELREALGSYCLFNGCANGINFHFAASWQIEKLDSILDLIEDDAEEAGLSDDWDTADEYLVTASENLEDVGTDQYEGTEHDDVWDNIRLASGALKDIISTLRSG